MAFIDASGLSKSFATPGGTREVLQNVSLSIDRGEFLAIVGMMGCGKSTLLNLLSGLTTPDTGSIQVDGAPLQGIRRDVSLVFQNYSLLPWFSAVENVRLAVEAAFPDWTKAQQRDRARESLERVGLGSAVHRRPSQLSGGMRQRVAIARAFATDPEILFLDEPFGALDALTRGSLQQDLSDLCASTARPVTVVMITNSVEEAILLADRIVPMTRGPRARLGTPIPVTLTKPRSADRLAHDPDAVRVRAHIVEALAGTLARANPPRPSDLVRVLRGDAVPLSAVVGEP